MGINPTQQGESPRHPRQEPASQVEGTSGSLHLSRCGDLFGSSTTLVFLKLVLYPLVNVYIANWKDPPFFMGKSTISMVIFNSYVTNYQRVSYPIGE